MRAVSFYTDPIAGPVPRTAPARGWWRFKHRVRSLVGLRRGFKVQGFYYKETSTELLAKALSRKGSGEKEYRVTFPDGSKLLVHCSLRRPFADIMGPVALQHYQRAQAMIRPGMRVVTAPCGTGHAVAWLAERVGPSGAVVALDADAESITYAQRRYARANVAFEPGGAASLAGEIDGSFDAAFSVRLDAEELDASLAREMWRVVAPGGWILLALPGEAPRAEIEKVIGSLEPCPAPEGGGQPIPARADWLSTSDDSFHVVVVRKLAG
jgi:SAM-dependent methyltransferase